MRNPWTGPKSYSMPLDTKDRETVADDTIITIDAHTGEPLSPHEQYNQPSLDPDDLKVVAVKLNDLGKPNFAIDVESERQALENNAEYEPTFTAIKLNDLVIAMAIAKTKCAYDEDMNGMLAITRVGRVINKSADILLAQGAQWMDIPGLRPVNSDDNQEYINPFDVLVNKQTLSFVDTHGNRLSPDKL